MVEDNIKMDILDGLSESLKQATAMEVKLTLLRKQDEANAFAKDAKKLSRRIDDAMGELIDEWAEQSATITDDIKKLNEQLATAKEQLSKNVDNSKLIVDAIGYLDGLTFIARRLLKP